MNQYNLGNFVNRFINYSLININQGSRGPNALNNALNAETLNQAILHKSLSQNAVLNTFSPSILSELRMNNLASLERGMYVKDLMNLPQDIEEVLVLIQNQTTTKEQAVKLLNTNINLSTLAQLIETNGKEAMNKLVLVMASASKQGMTDLSQIKDAIKFINASIAVASQENSSQIIKNFMLLYLPWLPLQEGVDFDIDIEQSQSEEGIDETTITILISTRNYGNVKVTLILAKGSSMEIFINCSKDFPKDELLLRLNEESKSHSVQSNITFEQSEMVQKEESMHQAKISISNLMAVNPFLLLMANAVIKHTIDLDNSAE